MLWRIAVALDWAHALSSAYWKHRPGRHVEHLMVSLLLDECDITDGPALPCTFLAHHEPESVYNIIALIITVLLVIMLSSIPICLYSSDTSSLHWKSKSRTAWGQ